MNQVLLSPVFCLWCLFSFARRFSTVLRDARVRTAARELSFPTHANWTPGRGEVLPVQRQEGDQADGGAGRGCRHLHHIEDLLARATGA